MTDSDNKKRLKKAGRYMSAGFGVAMLSNSVLADLQAGIYGINFTPESAAWTSASTLRSIGLKANGNDVGGFSQWNDSIGKSFSFNGGFAFWALAAEGQVISTLNFTGTNSGFYFTTGATGTVFFAFKATPTNGGGIGWFSADLGGSQGDILYGPVGAQYGDAGEVLTVGSSINDDPAPSDSDDAPSGDGVVPEPGHVSLALLALGAAGVSRRKARKKRQEALAG